MVDIIGNSFDGIGIIPSSKIIKGGHRTIIGSGSGLFRQVLGFDKGTHANASERNLLAKNSPSSLYSMTGPFAANILATRQRNGETYGLFESQYTTKNTYSEEADRLTKIGVTVNNNYENDLLGNLTADKIEETATGAGHWIEKAGSYTIGVPLVFSFILKAHERTGMKFVGEPGMGAGASYHKLRINLSSATLSVESGSFNWYYILPCVNDHYYITFSLTPDSAASIKYYIELIENTTTWAETYTGTLGYGASISMLNVIAANHLKSYIKAVASTVTKPGDYFYFPSASVPNWMKDKFTVSLTPNYDYPSQISADKPIWSFQKTASTVVSGSYGCKGVAANNTNIYFTNYSGGKIYRANLDGSSITELITGLNTPTDIAVDSTYIYWTTNNSKIQRALLDGSSVTDLVAGIGATTRGIDVTATHIYWSDITNSKIQRALLDGSGVTDIGTSISSTGVATDGTYVYLTTGGANIQRLLCTGGTAETLATGLNNLQHIATDGRGYLYFSSYGASTIHAISKKGGTVSTLAAMSGADGITAINGTLYYTASNIIKRLDTVTAWLVTDGKIKVVDGPDTKVETDALSCDMHDDVFVSFDRVAGTIQTVGFTGDDTFVGSSWTSPDGYDVEYGCALKGAAQLDGLAAQPEG